MYYIERIYVEKNEVLKFNNIEEAVDFIYESCKIVYPILETLYGETDKHYIKVSNLGGILPVNRHFFKDYHDVKSDIRHRIKQLSEKTCLNNCLLFTKLTIKIPYSLEAGYYVNYGQELTFRVMTETQYVESLL